VVVWVFACASVCVWVCSEDEDVSTWKALTALLSTAMMPEQIQQWKNEVVEEVEDEDKDEMKMAQHSLLLSRIEEVFYRIDRNLHYCTAQV
jgi:hypothetical protein